MPTVVYLAGQFPLRSETFVYREVRELRRRGWIVQCVTLHDPIDPPPHADDLLAGRIKVYDGIGKRAFAEIFRHPIQSIRTIGRGVIDAFTCSEQLGLIGRCKLIAQAIAALKLASQLRPIHPDHIHCHFAHSPTTLGMYAAKQLNLSFSFTGHANDLFQRRVLLSQKLSRADFVACISLEHRKLYHHLVERSDTDYPIIRCGVDTSTWESKPDIHSRMDDTTQIVTVCRLVEKKGVDTLIQACVGIQGNYHITIAGDGPQRTGLEQLVEQLNLRDRVTFLGSVDNDKVRELLLSSDIFALPCRVDVNGDKDGIPVVLMEAMACGLPVVSGDLPAIQELVIPDMTGLLVDGLKPEETTHAIQRLIDEPSLRIRLSIAGRQRVLDEFSLASNVDRLERQFK